ncbi:DUF5677 domain-containing protein [Sphingomonas sp. PP-CC-3G-468]|uniref:DUF5677 domain-containing protein n=1 Tax=Sphingomonas TaxID=13687 RepID=UPI0010509FC1|nr:DUF5677 domain-containing protein [Sphingomonas sp. PP-CC-3G-468]TCM09692.1 hypothetical protein C8J41_101193 [Sphingomonas sp. PP-CC-3G-468]
MNAEAMYRSARADFGKLVSAAEILSVGASGISSPTAQHYWASVLFTRLVVTAKSIQVLTPTLGPNTHVDFSAVASIVRNLAECYLFFFFLCIDDVPQDQKDARIILLNLHDDGSRAKLFAELGEKELDEETRALRNVVRTDLETKFAANTYLAALPEKRQRELLKGEKTPFVQDDVIDRTDLGKKDFRFFYRFLSNHTHTGPVAFYRMSEHGRGSGFRNEKDTFYMASALEFAATLMTRAIRDMSGLFPGAVERGRKMRSTEIRKPAKANVRQR